MIGRPPRPGSTPGAIDGAAMRGSTLPGIALTHAPIAGSTIEASVGSTPGVAGAGIVAGRGAAIVPERGRLTS